MSEQAAETFLLKATFSDSEKAQTSACYGQKDFNDINLASSGKSVTVECF